MSWYGVDYACGHSDRMQIYGPTRDRQRQADAEGRKDCPDCWRAKQDARNAEAALAASADAAASGLPELVGSPKQIAWAETIRQKMLADLAPLAAVRVGRRKEIAARGIAAIDDSRWSQIDAATDEQLRSYRAQSAAKWWIDHRDDSLYSLMLHKIGELAKTLFAAEVVASQAAKQAAIATEAAAKEAALAIARADAEAAKQISETAAAHFVPIRVERLNGQDVRITGEDGHTAMAYRDDGETVVYLIDKIHIQSMLPHAEALNRRIHALVPKR